MIKEIDVITITFTYIKKDELQQKVYIHGIFQELDAESQIETLERIKKQFDLIIAEIKSNGPLMENDLTDQTIH